MTKREIVNRTWRWLDLGNREKGVMETSSEFGREGRWWSVTGSTEGTHVTGSTWSCQMLGHSLHYMAL